MTETVGLCFDDNIHQKNLSSGSQGNLNGRNTSKKTAYNVTWGLRVLREWCDNHAKHSSSFERYSPEQFNELLCEFWNGVRRENGKYYCSSSLANLRAMINRYFKIEESKINLDIINDIRFRSSNEVFQTQLEILKKMGKQIVHKQPISADDLAKMYDSQTLSTNDPASLLRKVWFEITVHFCREGSKTSKKLKKTSFAIFQDNEERRYVGRVEESGNNDNNEIRMYEMKGNRCPVKSFELYLSKLHHDEISLFQQPRKQQSDGNSVWFGRTRIGEDALQRMMRNISTQANLSTHYTNQCARKTSPQQLSLVLQSNVLVPNHCDTQQEWQNAFSAFSNDEPFHHKDLNNPRLLFSNREVIDSLHYKHTANAGNFDLTTTSDLPMSVPIMYNGSFVAPYYGDILPPEENELSVSSTGRMFCNQPVLMLTNREESGYLHQEHTTTEDKFGLASNNGLPMTTYGHESRTEGLPIQGNSFVKAPLHYSQLRYTARNQNDQLHLFEDFPVNYLDYQQQQISMLSDQQQFDGANQIHASEDIGIDPLGMMSLSFSNPNVADASMEIANPYNFVSADNSFDSNDAYVSSTATNFLDSDMSVSERLHIINSLDL